MRAALLRRSAPVKALPFAALLRRHRLTHNWTQKQAAKAIGVGDSTYETWETGKHLPSLAHRDLIEEHLLGMSEGDTWEQMREALLEPE
jgi:transcriptional regulator with XRE-family HTH domain